MPNEPTLYVVEPSMGTAELIDRLARDLPAVVEPAREERRTYLDTFDRLMRRAGWVVESVPSLRGGDDVTLRTFRGGPSERGSRATELVRRTIGVRSLLPVATVRVVVRPLTVRNTDDKATVRLVVEEITTQHRRVGRWIRLLPVRGYDKAADRAREELGAARAIPGDDVVESLARAGLMAREAPPSLIDVSPGQTAAAAVVSVMQALLEVIEANLDGTVADTDPEFLHDYRVSVRRTRSALKHARGVLPEELIDCFAPEFRWLQEVTGPSRDFDVMDLWLAEEAAGNGTQLGPVRDLVARRRRDAHAAMVEAITSDRAKALLADWRSTLDHLAETADRPAAGTDAGEWGEWPEGAGRRIVDMLDDEIERFERRVHKQGDKIDDLSPPEDLHELRKRCKELRYLFELFGSALPAKRVGTFIKDLKGLQEVLGTFQDTAVQAGELRDFAADLAAEGAPAEAVDAVDSLVARILDRQAEARAAFAERYKRFAATTW